MRDSANGRRTDQSSVGLCHAHKELPTVDPLYLMDPVNFGWVLVQRARMHTDLGDSDAARSDSIEAQRIFPGDRDDPSVSALAASAAWSFYVAAAIKRYQPDSGHPASDAEREADQREAFGNLLVASDTTVSWWRSQHIASALSREQDASFESWAEDNPKTHVGGAPMPDTELFSAELNADVTGEHGTWRALAARRGQQTLMRAASSPDEADELVKGLDTLRRSGDSRHLTQAMGHLVRTGPLKPLVTAMNNIPASGWTQTTALSNFEALGLAGDLIERGDAKSSAAVRGWFAAYGDSDALAALKKGAIEGDIYALSAINSETAFDEHEAAALIEILEQRVQQTHTQALAGTGDDTSPTYCNALTRYNLLFPDAARWRAIIDLFGEPKAFIEDKRAICNAIATLSYRLPPETRNQLAPLIDSGAANFESFWPGSGAGGMAIRLKIALGLIDGTDIDVAVKRLVFGSHLERQDASLVLYEANCANRDLLLNLLAHDCTFVVRYMAAIAVGYVAATGTTDESAALAWELARSDGRQLPLALIRGIRDGAAAPYSLISDIAEFLAGHASAAIRNQAERLQQHHPSDHS